jgi:hypothetical protein
MCSLNLVHNFIDPGLQELLSRDEFRRQRLGGMLRDLALE